MFLQKWVKNQLKIKLKIWNLRKVKVWEIRDKRV